MTDTVNLNTLKTILESKGYSVIFGPPDKATEGQVNIDIDDYQLEIETPTIYHLHTFPALGISTSHPELLTDKIKKLITDVENTLYADGTLNRGSFTFRNIKFSKPGTLYTVSVVCQYRDIILITT